MDEIRKVTEDLAAASKAYTEARKLFKEVTGITVCESDRIQLIGREPGDENIEELTKHLEIEVVFRRRDDFQYTCERQFRFQDVDFLWVNNKPE